MSWPRALGTWVLIIAVESLHGVLRQLFLVPVVGDWRARQIGAVIASGITFAIAFALIRWIGARTLGAQLAVGFMWVVLTVGFEYSLGKLLGVATERMLADYDLPNGGLMGIALLFVLVTPVLAARARR
jgi:hypothetical protein